MQNRFGQTIAQIRSNSARTSGNGIHLSRREVRDNRFKEILGQSQHPVTMVAAALFPCGTLGGRNAPSSLYHHQFQDRSMLR
jgi:hypothetical protein